MIISLFISMEKTKKTRARSHTHFASTISLQKPCFLLHSNELTTKTQTNTLSLSIEYNGHAYDAVQERYALFSSFNYMKMITNIKYSFVRHFCTMQNVHIDNFIVVLNEFMTPNADNHYTHSECVFLKMVFI